MRRSEGWSKATAKVTCCLPKQLTHHPTRHCAPRSLFACPSSSFSPLLAPPSSTSNGLTNHHSHNSPLINRGYFARVCCVDLVLTRFLNCNPSTPVNVVEMGSGSSTLYLRMKSGELTSPSPAHPNLNYYETDFETVLANKVRRQDVEEASEGRR